MAITDLLVIITAVLLNRIPGIYFPGSFLSITPVCSMSTTLIYASRDCSVWLTVTFSFDRFIAICYQKLKIKYYAEKMAIFVIVMVCVLSCVKNIPWYFIHEPIYTIGIVPWYCRIKDVRYTSVAWKIFDWADRILTPCLPFLLILLFNAVTVRHILAVNRARKRLMIHKNECNQNDPEIESRRKSIVLLFAISGSFILLWLTYIIRFIYDRLTTDNKINGFTDPKFIFRECANMLQLLSCCTNTFIYAVTQSKFREQLINKLQSPLTLMRNLLKQ
ncbi:probable G-protein coupled receptor 139 [Chiloscyllium plagiosum]|uniref:probable G-protein coupled receptor 139 n=1 Tax=Chiloscyllium plagiosum TaxID=36176 RepID=UPI001CB82F20|nr:probable G-protein coupled receptor 139 [Chiloscyllium plagiosum]